MSPSGISVGVYHKLQHRNDLISIQISKIRSIELRTYGSVTQFYSTITIAWTIARTFSYIVITIVGPITGMNVPAYHSTIGISQ